MAQQVDFGNVPAALQAYLTNVKKASQRLGVNLNTAPLQLPPALSQGFTTPLGGRPTAFSEGILSALKTNNGVPALPGSLPVEYQDQTHYDPNAFTKGIEAASNDAELQAMGQSAPAHHSSLLEKTFHGLGALEHGLVGGIEDAGVNVGKGSYNPMHFLQGAKEGFTGHGTFANQDYGDLLNLASNHAGINANIRHDTGQALTNDMQQKNRIGGGWQHIVGAAGDLVLDPLNLVGVGEMAKLGKGARGLEDLVNSRRAISLKGFGKSLPLVPLPKKSEIISGIGKLPGEKASNLAHGLHNFKDLSLDAGSPSKIHEVLKGITDDDLRTRLADNTAEQAGKIHSLQEAHPYLTATSKMLTAPSKRIGETFAKGPHGLLGTGGRLTGLDNEERRQLLASFKGISDQDNKQLLATLKSQGYGPLATGHVVAKTMLHSNVAPVFAGHIEKSRMMIEDYLRHGGSVDHLNNELRYLHGPPLTPEVVAKPAAWQLWLSGLHGPQDAAHLAYSLRNGVDHAVVHNDLADMLKSNHGYRIPKITKGKDKGKYVISPKNVAGQAKVDAGFIPVNHPLFKDAEGNATHLFHPDVATRIQNLFHLLAEPKGKSTDPTNVFAPFLKKFDRAQNTYKRAVTVYNPGSHTRYLMSSILQMMINGFHNPHNLTRAARVVLHHDPAAKYRQFLGHVDPDILRLPNYRKASQGKGFTVMHSKTLGRDITDQEVWHDMARYGLTHNFIHAQLSPEGLGGGGKLNRLNEALLHFGESRDNIPRIAMYLDALERAPKGLSEADAKQWAGDQVLKAAHNFSDLTRTERNVMQRLVPFYADIRKNMPMIMKSLVTHPGRVAAYPLALQEAEEGSGGLKEENNPFFKYLTPDYLMSSGAVPVGHHGDNPMFLNQKNHLSDLFYQLGGQPLSGSLPNQAGQEANFVGRQFGLSTLTPFLRIPAEIEARRQFYSGNPINSPLRYATQQLPLSNAIQKIFENKSKGGGDTGGGVNPGNPLLTPALINYLTGLGLSENSPVQQQAAANSKAIPSKKRIQKLLPATRVP